MNLVLFFSTQCRFCQQSLPFYKRLAERLHRRPEIAFRVLSVERSEDVRNFLDQRQVAVMRAEAANPVAFRAVAA